MNDEPMHCDICRSTYHGCPTYHGGPRLKSPMKALFNVVIRKDLEGSPLQIHCELLGGRQLAVDVDAKDGWVDAKQLVRTLRTVANLIEKEVS